MKNGLITVYVIWISHMGTLVIAANPKYRWPMDASPYERINQGAGVTPDGTAGPATGTQLHPTGRYGSGTGFDGSGYVKLDISMGGCVSDIKDCATGFTYAFWIKPEYIEPDPTHRHDKFFLSTGAHEGIDGVSVRYSGIHRVYEVAVLDNGMIYYVWFDLQPAAWHYVSFAYKNSTLNLYVNNVLLGSSSGSVIAVSLKALEGVLYVGGIATMATSYANAIIDDITFFEDKVTNQESLFFFPTGSASLASDKALTSMQMEIGYHIGTYIYIDKPFTVNFNYNDGPIRSVQVCFGDGGDMFAATEDEISHVYSSPGVYNISVRVGNTVSEWLDNVEVEAIEIKGKPDYAAMWANDVQKGDEVIINRVMYGGENLTTEIMFGDRVLEIFDEEGISYGQGDLIQYNYTYNETGNYNITMTNYFQGGFTLSRASINIIPDDPIEVEMETDIPLPVGEPAEFKFNTTGLGVFGFLYFGSDRVNDTTFDWNPDSGEVILSLSNTSSYCYGGQKGKLAVTDGFKVTTKLLDISFVLPIEGLFLNSSADARVEGTNDTYSYFVYDMIDIFFGVTGGNFLDFYLVFADNTSLLVATCNQSEVTTLSLNVSNSYSEQGDYVVVLSAMNPLVTHNTNITLAIRIRLPKFELETDYVFVPGAFDVTFMLRLSNTSDLVPETFFLELDFGDGNVKKEGLTDSMFIADTLYTHNVTHSFSEEGIFNATALTYTELETDVAFTLVEAIIKTDMNVTADTYRVSLGEYANFTIQGITAACVSYVISFGDGTYMFISEKMIISPDYSVPFVKLYNESGNYNVTVEASTALHNLTASVPTLVIVQARINGLRLTVAESVLPYPGSLVRFSIMQEDETAVFESNGVQCNFTFGDGDMYTEDDMLIPFDPLKELKYNHTYKGPFTTEPTEFILNVTCANDVNRESNSSVIIVEALVFNHSAPVILDDSALGVFPFTLYDKTINNLDMSITDGINVLYVFGDGTDRYEALSAFPQSHTFPERGNYTVNITINYTAPDGFVQSLDLSDVIQVGMLHIWLPENLTASLVDIYLYAWGWFPPYKYEVVSYGDPTAGSAVCLDTDTNCRTDDHYINFTYAYQADGVFKITVKVSDPAGATSETLLDWIHVQHSVEPVGIETSTPRIIVPGVERGYERWSAGEIAYFTIVRPPGAPQPSNTTCILDYNDTISTPNEFVLDFLGANSIASSRSYDDVMTEHALVVANVTLGCCNLVSCTNVSVGVQLVERITNISLYVELGYTQIGYPLLHLLCATTGANLTFFINFNDKSLEPNATLEGNETQLCFETTHAYELPNEFYNSTGYIENHMQHVKLGEEDWFDVETFQVVNVTLDDFNYSVPLENPWSYERGCAPVVVSIQVQDAYLPPANLSVSIGYGDMESYFGILDSMKYEHCFKTVGEFMVTFTGILHENGQLDNYTLNVTLPSTNITTFFPCLGPVVRFNQDFKTKKTSFVVETNTDISISSDRLTRCQQETHKYEWTITWLKDDESKVLDPIFTKTNVLSFPAGRLGAGLYHLELNVSVDDPSYDLRIYSAASDMHFIVTPAALQCSNQCGGSILAGEAHIVDLSQTECLDPGTKPNVDHLKFSWGCKLLTPTEEQMPQADVSMDPACFVYESFHKGAGVLVIDGDRVPVGCYVFRLDVSSDIFEDDRKTFCTRKVCIINGDPPQTHIQLPPYYKGKMNADLDFTLDCKCDGCINTDVLSHQWSVGLIQSNGATSQLDTENGQFVFVSGKSRLIVYADTLDIGKMYRFKCVTSREGDPDGEASVDVMVNIPPRVGVCGSRPIKGDPFVVRNLFCEGFEDEGQHIDYDTGPNEIILMSYTFSANGKVIASVKSFSDLPIRGMRMEQGLEEDDYMVRIDVNATDQFGGVAKYNFSVEVAPSGVIKKCEEGDEPCRLVLEENLIKLSESIMEFDPEKQDLNEAMAFLTVVAKVLSDINVPKTAGPNMLMLNEDGSPPPGVDLKNAIVSGNVIFPLEEDPNADKSKEDYIGPYGQALLSPAVLVPSGSQLLMIGVQNSMVSSLSTGIDYIDSVDSLAVIMNTLIVVVEMSESSGTKPSDQTLELMKTIARKGVQFLQEIKDSPPTDVIKAATSCLDFLSALVKAGTPDKPSVEPPPEENTGKEDFLTDDEIKQKEKDENAIDIGPMEITLFTDVMSKKQKFKEDQQATEAVREILDLVQGLAMDIVAVLAASLIPNQPPVVLRSESLSLSAVIIDITNFQSENGTKNLDFDGTIFSFPKGFYPTTSQFAVAAAVKNPTNIYTFGSGSDTCTGEVVSVQILDEHGQKMPVPQLGIAFPIDVNILKPKATIPTLSPGDESGCLYNRYYITETQNSLTLKMNLEPDVTDWNHVRIALLFIRIGKPVTPTKYDIKTSREVDAGRALIITLPRSLSKKGKLAYVCVIWHILVKKSQLVPERRKRDTVTQNDMKRRVRRETRIIHEPQLNRIVPDPENYIVFNSIDMSHRLLQFDSSLNLDAYLKGYYYGNYSSLSDSRTLTYKGYQFTLNEFIYLYQSGSPKFSTQSASTGCRIWDNTQQRWSSDTCQAGENTTLQTLDCRCDEPAGVSFVSSFFVAPNTIDFNMIFANFDPSNIGVLLVCVVIIISFIPCGFCLKRSDKRDVLKWGVTHLIGNKKDDSHFYMMSVYTGMRSYSGTASKIGFALAGSEGDTGIRSLSDGIRKRFQRGTVKRFLLSVPNDLGDLKFLRIWHDGSGWRSWQSWFLDRIVIQDLIKGTRYVFKCSQWLAIDKGDGKLVRLLRVNLKKKNSKETFVQDNVRNSITEDHLFLSTFSRPTPSNFTRLQRLGCIMSFLFMTMIANAMFFGTEGSEPRPIGFNIGPLRFTLTHIYTAMISALIVAPVNIIVITLFQKARPKDSEFRNDGDSTKGMDEESMAGDKKMLLSQRRSMAKYKDHPDEKPLPLINPETNESETKHVDDEGIEEDTNDGIVFHKDMDDKLGSPSSAESQITDGSQRNLNKAEEANGSAKSSKINTLLNILNGNMKSDQQLVKRVVRSYFEHSNSTLPHWATYIAWTLIALVVFSSSFFCILYSQQWGKVKSEEWLSTFIVTVIGDMIIIDPVKIIVIAILAGWFVKKPAEQVELQLDSRLKMDEEFIEEEEIFKDEGEESAKGPLGESEIKRLKMNRQRENDMNLLIWEIIVYIFMLTTIWTMSFNNRDSRSIYIHNLITNTILEDTPGTMEPEGFRYVTSTIGYLEWIQAIFIPEFFAVEAYNGDGTVNYDGTRMHWKDRRFLVDANNYRVGPSRLRQLRVPRGDVKNIHSIVIKGSGAYDALSHEEKGDYCIGWKDPPCDPLEVVDNFTSSSWKHTKSADVLGVPQWGTRLIYAGGGYIANLDVNRDASKLILQELWRGKWIDDTTRVVFMEYTIYNANVNLFSVVTLLLEYMETGGVQPFVKIQTFRVYLHEGKMGMFVYFCEAAFCVFLFYLIIQLIWGLYKKGFLGHFTNGWNILDVIIIICGCVSISLYLARMTLSDVLMRNFRKDPTKFVNFQMVAEYDEYFSCVLGIVVFFCTIKLMGIFNFNDDISAFLKVVRVGRVDLISYSVIFLSMYFAFGMLGYVMFGTVSIFYHSIVASLAELMGTMLGKIHFDEALMLEPIMTKVFFILYIILSVAVLMNILIVIICDAIDQVNQDKRAHEDRYELISFMMNHFRVWMGFEPTFMLKDELDEINKEKMRQTRRRKRQKQRARKIRKLAMSEDEMKAAVWCITLSLQMSEIQYFVDQRAGKQAKEEEMSATSSEYMTRSEPSIEPDPPQQVTSPEPPEDTTLYQEKPQGEMTAPPPDAALYGQTQGEGVASPTLPENSSEDPKEDAASSPAPAEDVGTPDDGTKRPEDVVSPAPLDNSTECSDPSKEVFSPTPSLPGEVLSQSPRPRSTTSSASRTRNNTDL